MTRARFLRRPTGGPRADALLSHAATAFALALGGSMATAVAQRDALPAIEAALTSAAGTDRLELLWQRAVALRAVHVPTARDAAVEFAAAARDAARPDYECVALLLQAGMERNLANGEAAAPLRAAAMALPPPTDPRLRGHRELALCQADTQAFHFGAAVRHLQAAMADAAAADDATLRAACQIAFQNLLKNTGFDPVVADVDDLAAEVAGLTRRVGLDATRFQLEARIRTGREAEVAELALAALKRATASGDHLLAWNVHSCLLWQAWQTGRYDQAVAHAEAAERTARALGNDELLAASLDGKAWSCLLDGTPDAVGEWIDTALQLARAIGLPPLELRVLESAVNLAIARQDKEALLRHATRRKEVVEQTGRELDPRDREVAATELGAMLDTARKRDAADRTAAQQRTDQLHLTILLGSGAALLVAGSLFVARRRLLRVHRQLVAETDRARASERAQRQLEARMRHLERLDSLGLLAAGVAHDFNNLLTVIRGNAELLELRGAAAAAGATAEILAASDRAALLCRRMLDHARPQLGSREVCDLREVVRAMQPLLGAISSGSVTIDLQLGTAPVPAAIDRAALEQAVLNLCANAVEAYDATGAIVVRVRTADAKSLDDEAGCWFGTPPTTPTVAVVEVVDRGRGIAAEQLRRVFDPFFSTRFEGRGLGLSVAYGVVRALDGAILVDSSPGRGSRFAIHLAMAAATPAQEAIAAGPSARETAVAQVAGSAPGAAPRPSAPGTVLLVDDDDGVRRWIEATLATRGHRVLATASGDEAMDLFADHPEATVLLDVSMPHTDGPTLFAAMRQLRTDARIVIISGHGATDVRQRFPPEPGLVVLQKPFAGADLLAAIAGAARPA